jgi:hypothetical protein
MKHQSKKQIINDALMAQEEIKYLDYAKKYNIMYYYV